MEGFQGIGKSKLSAYTLTIIKSKLLINPAVTKETSVDEVFDVLKKLVEERI